MPSITNRPVIRTLTLVFALGLLPTTATGAQADTEQTAKVVSVGLASGRDFDGAVDARTDEQHLWLRWESDRGVILRPIRWDRIVAAVVDGRPISGQRVREALVSARSEHPRFPPPDPRSGGIVLAPRPAEEELRSAAVAEASLPEAGIGSAAWRPRRVRSLAIDVQVANWDADVEVDGLLLDVYPLDAEGQTVPVAATLQVELTGERTGIVRRPWPFVRLGRWTRLIRPDMVSANGARFRLPFPASHPQWEADLASFGLVHVRLNVPGHGVFEASDATVRIRPYGLMRDRLQEHSGHRFFAPEMTGR